jgi:hypothetical protein
MRDLRRRFGSVPHALAADNAGPAAVAPAAASRLTPRRAPTSPASLGLLGGAKRPALPASSAGGGSTKRPLDRRATRSPVGARRPPANLRWGSRHLGLDPSRGLGAGGCISVPRARGEWSPVALGLRDDRHLVNQHLTMCAAGTLVRAVPDLLAGEVVCAAHAAHEQRPLRRRWEPGHRPLSARRGESFSAGATEARECPRGRSRGAVARAGRPAGAETTRTRRPGREGARGRSRALKVPRDRPRRARVGGARCSRATSPSTRAGASRPRTPPPTTTPSSTSRSLSARASAGDRPSARPARAAQRQNRRGATDLSAAEPRFPRATASRLVHRRRASAATATIRPCRGSASSTGS